MNKLQLAKPSVGDAELAAVGRVLATGMMTRGPEVDAFASELATLTNRKHAVSVSSGTTALELSMWAIDLKPGDEVIVPGFGFPSAATAVARLGGVVVPADVEPKSWNLCPKSVEAVATPKTRALISIDQFGLVSSSEELKQIANARNWEWISDSACAVGASAPSGIPAGKNGRAAIFSFHPRKLIAAGEGGAVVTDDDDFADDVRARRNLGQIAPGNFAKMGTNARLSDIAAAIARVQLQRLDAMISERQLLVDGYKSRLSDLLKQKRLSWQIPPNGAIPANQTFAVLLSQNGPSREQVAEHLGKALVACGPATYAAHRVLSYVNSTEALPMSEKLHDHALAIPLFSGMRSADLDRVASLLEEALT